MKIVIKNESGKIIALNVDESDTILKVKLKIQEREGIPPNQIRLFLDGIQLEDNKTLKDYNIQKKPLVQIIMKRDKKYEEESSSDDSYIDEAMIENECMRMKISDEHCLEVGKKISKDRTYSKEINIKFIKEQNNNKNKKNYISIFLSELEKKKEELHGLLKLCLLKELSSKLEKNQIRKLPELLSYILLILKNGEIDEPIKKEEIKKVLEKIKGSNIINFSNYVEESINSNDIKMLLNNKYKLLNNKDLSEINEIKNCLLNYNEYIKLFSKDFEERKKDNIFEFSIISLVIMEREDFQKFEEERKKCPNRVDRILYHGTNIEPISCILTGYFKKSIEKCYQHGKGVYFTDMLDYCWFYGGKTNRINGNKIPKIDETFTLISCSVYYDEKGYRKVKDYKYTPKKNEINFAYAKEDFSTIKGNPDYSKFFGTEYVIWDLEQICPLIGAKLKRNEFCVIWRDNNFSLNPVYNKKFDEIFKKFLKERMKYIKQFAEYNIYPCETSNEALNLINKKKYNKIILISNIGTDLGGKNFIDEARKIIGNDVIALFIAYNINHLDWVKNYKNALFSNEPNFYEKYINCFNDEYYDKKYKILELKQSIENYYKVKFNFDDNFLYYPKYKDEGNFSELVF